MAINVFKILALMISNPEKYGLLTKINIEEKEGELDHRPYI
jgi:hypothetical protein